MAGANPFAVFGDDGEDDLSSFAALPGRMRESVGTSLYDDAANSIRSYYGKPMTDQANGDYARQSGALAQLGQSLGGDRKAEDRDKWLSVAAALLSPTQTGKTSESLANALGVYAKTNAAQRDDERTTSLALAKLMQQYQIADRRAKAVEYKTEHPDVVLDVLGQARDRRTGAVVADASGQMAAEAPPEAADIPVVSDQASFDALQSGEQFYDPKGNLRVKP